MSNAITEMERPIFLSVKDAVKATGLSEYYFRQSLKAGKIPHIRSGKKILINMPLLEAELNKMTTTDLVSL